LKIPITKKGTGRVAQVLEHLLSKHEALNSNSDITKKKKPEQKGYKKPK
jgi:primosomal protein N'